MKCGTNVFAPFGFMKDGKIQGIEVELMYEVARRLGIDISINIYKWATLLESMRFGTLDCMFAAFQTKDRLEFMHYTNVPVHISSLVFYVHEDKPMPFKGKISDLQGNRIGIVQGFKNPYDFEKGERRQMYQVFRLRDLEINFKILQKHCIDAVLVNRHVGEYTLGQLKMDGVYPLSVPLTATPAYITFSKFLETKEKELVKDLSYLVPQFDAVLFEIFTDGTYQKIFNKYMNQ
ncbi:MAG: amino acid ABC transporter periplasmic protein [Candidatus Magnetoglobus multicellularis str. Araruama]|uniref:Amino acid ABC transporter periplasmic protein n=1 Tax=Candidatus Magnetoglobus multicellularis str. Araruama TaxID=890399 RepID=A0A1V1PB38_9BACT|nr:MAG: amino acid ABC transporter periplasmic protein [Candidatus Magnetoglobus multicellularis str. Araruama]